MQSKIQQAAQLVTGDSRDDVSDTFNSLYPSFFSVCLPYLILLLNLVASSSFKNHFTLGKTQTSFELLMHLSVCWMAEINKLFYAYPFLIEGQSLGHAAADQA